MLYCSVFGSIIGVSISSLVWFEVFVPHCFSLRCFAVSCALFLCCMCIPSAFLLWKGVGVYFLFKSLIPNHLSLMSSSFDTDSIILLFLSSLLLFVNWVFSVMNRLRFLSLAAFFFVLEFLLMCMEVHIFDFCLLVLLLVGLCFLVLTSLFLLCICYCCSVLLGLYSRVHSLGHLVVCCRIVYILVLVVLLSLFPWVLFLLWSRMESGLSEGLLLCLILRLWLSFSIYG